MTAEIVDAGSLATARFQQLRREVFWVGLGQAVAGFGGIVGVRLLTHALPPSAYGELALGMTVAMLAQQTVLGPLSGAALRFYAPAQEAIQMRAYLLAVGRLVTRATALLLVVAGAVCMGLWGFGQKQWMWLAIGAFLFALLSGYSVQLDSMQNAARERVVVAWHDGMAPWLRFITAVTMIGVLGAYSYVAIFGYVLACIVILASQLWFFRRGVFALSTRQTACTASEVRNWTEQMYTYAWPFATWGLFSWAQMASDRWALQTFSTTSTVGEYAVLYQLGYYPVSILSGMIMQLVTPILFNRAGHGSDPSRLQDARRLNNQLTLAVVLLTMFATLLTIIFHSQLFALLVAPEYRQVSSLLPCMVLSAGLFALGQSMSLLLMADIATRQLIVPKIATALMGIGFNVAGAYTLGLPGVVFASLLFSCVYCMWILYLANRLRLWARVMRSALVHSSINSSV